MEDDYEEMEKNCWNNGNCSCDWNEWLYSQQAAKSYGGSTTIELPPNQKLEEITWKDDSLWYLTRPMTDDDIVETHTFQQSSSFGIFEGTVTIVESKCE